MKKKQYITPCVEVMKCNTTLMKMTGPASQPSQDFAPRRRTTDVF